MKFLFVFLLLSCSSTENIFKDVHIEMMKFNEFEYFKYLKYNQKIISLKNTMRFELVDHRLWRDTPMSYYFKIGDN